MIRAIAARLITAPAGQGKTRLGLRLSDLLSEEGWLAGFVAEQASVDTVARVASAPIPLLLVLDYAEGRPTFLAEVASAIRAEDASHCTVRLSTVTAAGRCCAARSAGAPAAARA